MQNTQTTPTPLKTPLDLLKEGKLIRFATFFDGAVDTISYTDKNTGQPTQFHQIKLGVRLKAGNNTKLVDAVMRVKENEDAAKVLKEMNLKGGSTVILDVDSLVKNPPAKKGAESTWTLRIYGAYNWGDDEK